MWACLWTNAKWSIGFENGTLGTNGLCTPTYMYKGEGCDAGVTPRSSMRRTRVGDARAECGTMCHHRVYGRRIPKCIYHRSPNGIRGIRILLCMEVQLASHITRDAVDN